MQGNFLYESTHMSSNNSLEARRERAITIINCLRKTTKNMPLPMSQRISEKYRKNPFLILISCLLSLRARDTMTYPVSVELFKRAKTPQEMLEIPLKELEKIIHSIGFYKNKAQSIHSVCRELLDRFHGKVPNTKEDLLSIKGIGPKTANLVLGVAFDIPAICVDVHVHRLSNQFGIVSTKNVKETEQALQEVLPKSYWIEYNKLMVMWGQNTPRRKVPACPKCPISELCECLGINPKKNRQ